MNSFGTNVCQMDGFTVAHSVKVCMASTGIRLSLHVTASPKWLLDRDTARYVGRVQIGEIVSFFARCVPGGKPITPDAPGVYRVYGPAGVPSIRSGRLPVETTDAEAVGLARGSFATDNTDLPGRYVALFSFATSGTPRSEILSFEMIRAGHQLGSILSLFRISRPDSIAIVAHAESGKTITGRGPYLDEGV